MKYVEIYFTIAGMNFFWIYNTIIEHKEDQKRSFFTLADVFLNATVTDCLPKSLKN